MCESRILYAIAIFVIGAAFKQSKEVSGAFEIFLNDELVLSKISSGHVPNMQ